MTTETHPAVSVAMREALSPDLASLLIDAGAAHLIGVQKFRQLLSFLVRPSGPLASEIARLTERMESAEQYVTILIGEKREVEAERDAAAKDRDKLDLLVASYRSPPRLYTLCDMQASLDRALAAEADLTRMRAETERLRAALQDVADIAPEAKPHHWDCELDQVCWSLAKVARTALSNPEQTDA